MSDVIRPAMRSFATHTTALRLGFRIAVARGERARSLLLIIAGGIAATCFAAVFLSLSANASESERASSLRAWGFERGIPVTVHRLDEGALRLVWIDPGDSYGGDRFASDRLSVGEMLVSPALGELLANDRHLRSWLTYDNAGQLPTRLVGDPDELVAHVATTDAAVLDGDVGEMIVGEHQRMHLYQVLGFVVFLGLPAVVLLLTAARFGRSSREIRLRRLRVVGLPRSSAYLTVGAEVAFPTVVGAVVAVITIGRIMPTEVTVPIVGRTFFGSDMRLSATVLAFVAAGTALAGAALATFGLASPHELRHGSGVRRGLGLLSPVMVLPYVVGVAVGLWAWSLEIPQDPRRVAAALLMGVGLPAAIAWSAARLGRLLSPGWAPLVWLLGLRRLAADGRTAARLPATVAIAVFAAGVSQPFAQLFHDGSATWHETAARAGESSLVWRAQPAPSQRLELPTGAPDEDHSGIRAMVVELLLRAIGDGTNAEVRGALVASCEQLAALTQDDPAGCDGGRQRIAWVGAFAAPQGELPPTGELRIDGADGGAGMSFQVPQSTVGLLAPSMPVEADVLLPPGDPVLANVDEPVAASHVYARVDSDPDDVQDFQAWIWRGNPTAVVESAHQANESRDSTGLWIVVGMCAASLIAVVTALLVVADDQRRMRRLVHLQAVGCPRLLVVALDILGASLVSGIAMALAWVSSGLVAAAVLSVNGETLRDTSTVNWAAGLGFVALVVLAAASALLQSRLRAR